LTDRDELKALLSRVLTELRTAIVSSVAMRSHSKTDARDIALIWEGFLGAFIGYIMKKGRETGQNLLDGISFRNIWRR